MQTPNIHPGLANRLEKEAEMADVQADLDTVAKNTEEATPEVVVEEPVVEAPVEEAPIEEAETVA